MQVNHVMQALIDIYPGSGRQLAAALDRAPTWTYNTARAADNMLGTVADVADVAGVDLMAVDRASGRALWTVEPPRRAAAVDPADGAGA